MGKEARNKKDLDLAPEVREKFEELVTLLSAHGFGPDGPPIDTTFAQIEAFGHQAGQMMARAIDEQLGEQHSEHFHRSKRCPACQADAEGPSFHVEHAALGLEAAPLSHVLQVDDQRVLARQHAATHA